VVTFRFTIPDVGEILMFQTHLPIAPMMQKVNFHWFAEPRIPRLLVSYVVGNWVSQWRNDLAIWENKIHRPKPLLVQEDGPIHRLRRWFAQFYPDSAAAEKARLARAFAPIE
jgi:cholesterol 7-desaturase